MEIRQIHTRLKYYCLELLTETRTSAGRDMASQKAFVDWVHWQPKITQNGSHQADAERDRLVRNSRVVTAAY